MPDEYAPQRHRRYTSPPERQGTFESAKDDLFIMGLYPFLAEASASSFARADDDHTPMITREGESLTYCVTFVVFCE